MSMNATNTTTTEPQGPVNVDPLLDLPDDPIFSATEPFKGGDRKAVFAALPDDAKKEVQNLRIGAQKAAAEAIDARKAADAEKAAAETARKEAEANAAAWKAKLDAYKPDEGDALAPFAADDRLAKLYGLREGSVFDAPPEIEVDVPEFGDDVMSDPAKLREMIKAVARSAAVKGAEKAREEFVDLQRASMKPVLERAASAKVRQQQEAAANTEAEWRKAHPGMDTPEGWGDFYTWSKAQYGVDGEKWPYDGPKAFTVGYKAYAAEKGIAAPAATTTTAEPPVVAETAKRAPTQVEQLMSALRRGAQDAQGGGGVGIEDGELIMPMHIRGNPMAVNRWIEQTPAAKAAFDAKDTDAIKRIMRAPSRK